MHVSRSLYRLLLRLCPGDLRTEFGADMEALFVSDLARARGVRKAAAWGRAISDLLRHGVGARHDRWQRVRDTSAYVESDTRDSAIAALRYDLRYAIRAIGRRPMAAGMIIVTLALAIGANTAVFSAVDTVLLRPLPYPHPEDLTMVWEKREAEGVMDNSVSAADFLDWSRMATSFTAMAAFTEVTVDLTGAGEPEKVTLQAVTAAYFDVLGVRPMLGRTFVPGEDAAGRERVVVLAHSLWQQRFGSDASIVGRSITLNATPFQVIGVLPANAAFPHTEAQLFAPLVLVRPGQAPPSRTSHGFGVYARLAPRVSFEQARAEMDRIGKQLESAYPQFNRGHGANVTMLADQVTAPVARTLMVLMAAVAFVLLIACINVTNLLLAAAAGRRREMAVRAAIGAGRLRLVRQMVVECVVLAAVGAAAGLLIAIWSVQVLGAQLPALVRPDHTAVLSVPVLLFTIIVTMLAGVGAAAIPAWHVVRDDPAESLKEGGRSPVSLRRRLRFSLIVAEVALTSLLLVGAGLTLRSFAAVVAQPAGIATADRLTFRISLPGGIYRAEGASRLFAEMESRLAAEAQVASVGAIDLPPLTGLDGRQGIVIENREVTPGEGPTRAHPRIATASYTRAIGATIRAGRGFLPSDTAAATPVVLINETMAKRYWPGASPLGKRVRFADQEQWREVVGVIGDIKHWGLDAPVNPEIYVPALQRTAWAMTFIVHTTGDPLALVPIVRRHVNDLDPNVPLFQVRTMEEIAAKSLDKRQWTMTLLATFSLLALLLAAAGIYGVMAHLVSLRTPEIGVRLTLGARPMGVMRQVMGEGLLQAAIGLAIGLAASLGVMRGLRTMLFGVEPTDPITLVSVGVSLMFVALLAVAIPAVRAMKVDPITALRN